jgi:hypothetical protein
MNWPKKTDLTHSPYWEMHCECGVTYYVHVDNKDSALFRACHFCRDIENWYANLTGIKRWTYLDWLEATL